MRSVELGKLKFGALRVSLDVSILGGASDLYPGWKFEDLRSIYVLCNLVQDQEVGICYLYPYFVLQYVQLGFLLLTL